jgi:hypothetical protein
VLAKSSCIIRNLRVRRSQKHLRSCGADTPVRCRLLCFRFCSCSCLCSCLCLCGDGAPSRPLPPGISTSAPQRDLLDLQPSPTAPPRRATLAKMAKSKPFDLESPPPVVNDNDEDEETLAAIDEGMRDAEAGRTVPAKEVRRLLPKWITNSPTRKKR